MDRAGDIYVLKGPHQLKAALHTRAANGGGVSLRDPKMGGGGGQQLCGTAETLLKEKKGKQNAPAATGWQRQDKWFRPATEKVAAWLVDATCSFTRISTACALKGGAQHSVAEKGSP